MVISKKVKSKVINNLYNYLKTSNISKKSLGIIIRSYHYASPTYLLLMLSFGNNILVTISIIYVIISTCLFGLFNGCYLSKLENKLCKDNFTVVDPVLEYYGIDINNKNRMQISYKIATIYISIFIAIYCYRFLFTA